MRYGALLGRGDAIAPSDDQRQALLAERYDNPSTQSMISSVPEAVIRTWAS
jgi:hypothetical protein